jgi:hypothetical protein
MVGWGKQVIRLLGHNSPLPADALELCLMYAHYPEKVKDTARAHQTHVILYYAGYETSPFEQYLALAATAGVLARLGATVVLNEAARTSIPAGVLSGMDTKGDILELIRAFPLPTIFCGFVKHIVPGSPGLWMRTCGASTLGLPDFAALAKGNEESQRYLDLFNDIMGYIRDTKNQIVAGNTMQIDEDEYLRFRAPRKDEAFLETDGIMLVIEIIRANEINRRS